MVCRRFDGIDGKNLTCEHGQNIIMSDERSALHGNHLTLNSDRAPNYPALFPSHWLTANRALLGEVRRGHRKDKNFENISLSICVDVWIPSQHQRNAVFVSKLSSAINNM